MVRLVGLEPTETLSPQDSDFAKFVYKRAIWYLVLVTIQLQQPYQDCTSPLGLLGIIWSGTTKCFYRRYCHDLISQTGYYWYPWRNSNPQPTDFESIRNYLLAYMGKIKFGAQSEI